MIESELVKRIMSFCRQVEMKPTKFGLRSVNDPGLVFDLLAGRELRSKTRERIERFMVAYPKRVGRKTASV